MNTQYDRTSIQNRRRKPRLAVGLRFLLGILAGWLPATVSVGQSVDAPEVILGKNADANQPPRRERIRRAELGPEPLFAVKDNTTTFRDEESESLAFALNRAAESPASWKLEAVRKHYRLRRQAIEKSGRQAPDALPILSEMQEFPDAYRGQLVLVYGCLTSLKRYNDLTGPRAPAEVYKATLQPDMPTEPDTPSCSVLFQTLPKTLQEGTDLREPAMVIGYFFKLCTTSESSDGEEESLPDSPPPSRPVIVADTVLHFGLHTDPELLQGIKDKTRWDETDRKPYLTMLVQARLLDKKKMKRDYLKTRTTRIGQLSEVIDDRRRRLVEQYARDPSEFPRFADLFEHPWAYRGKPITLQGHLRRLQPQSVGPNEYGFDKLYDAALFTPDGQEIPAIILCQDVPRGIPTGSDLEPHVDHVSVTGLFYKLRVYGTQADQTHFVPVLIADRIEWNPIEYESIVPKFGPAVYIVSAIVFLGIAAFVVYSLRKGEEVIKQRTIINDATTDGGFAGLTSTDPEEILAQLEQQDAGTIFPQANRKPEREQESSGGPFTSDNQPTRPSDNS